jgi:hypothetical protein
MAKKKEIDYFNWSAKEKRELKRLTEGRIAGGREPKSAERLSIVDMLIARQRERKGQKGKKGKKKD